MNDYGKKLRWISLSILSLTTSSCLFAQTQDSRSTLGSLVQTQSSPSVTGVSTSVPQLRSTTTLQAPTPASARTESPPPAVFSPPLPPNDFQKFIAETTGQNLKLFGMDFFENSKIAQEGMSPYAPQTNVPVSQDYPLGPGDEVVIRGWGSMDIDIRAVIDRNGTISIPRVGSVQLAGVKAAQAQATVHAAIGRYYRDFELSVTLGQLRSITVYLVGQARKPGAYNLSSLSTLVSGLFASGGPSETGSLRRVLLKRANETIVEFDLYQFLSKGLKQGDQKLLDGDVIVIPAAHGYVALTGAVTTPGIYEIRDDKESIEDLLSVAGGLPVLAQTTQVKLERITTTPGSTEPRSVESITLDAQGLKRQVRRGDLLLIPNMPASFANAVTLRGNVAEPARRPWYEGMRIRDLIPNKESLMSRASVQKQNQVLLIGRENKDTSDTLAGRIGNLLEEVNLDYAVIERVNPKDLSVQLIPFNLGNVLNDSKDIDNQLLQSRDVVTVFSATDVRVPLAKRRVFVRVEGEVARPGVYQMAANDTVQTLVDKAGGVTRDAYLFGSAFYREEVRKAQEINLKNLVQRLEAESASQSSQFAQSTGSAADAGQAQSRIQTIEALRKQSLERIQQIKPAGRIALNLSPLVVSHAVSQLPALRLESGDRLVIPSRPDFVYVFGAVNTESALIFVPGKTVSDYLNQSGSTASADRDNVILMRADGSAITHSGGWGNSVMRMVVLPGDSIVLPEKLDRETAWSVFTRNAKDITQIMYQFGLGVAAYRLLR